MDTLPPEILVHEIIPNMENIEDVYSIGGLEYFCDIVHDMNGEGTPGYTLRAYKRRKSYFWLLKNFTFEDTHEVLPFLKQKEAKGQDKLPRNGLKRLAGAGAHQALALLNIKGKYRITDDLFPSAISSRSIKKVQDLLNGYLFPRQDVRYIAVENEDVPMYLYLINCRIPGDRLKEIRIAALNNSMVMLKCMRDLNSGNINTDRGHIRFKINIEFMQYHKKDISEDVRKFMLENKMVYCLDKRNRIIYLISEEEIDEEKYPSI
jgi:hypothetical protein